MLHEKAIELLSEPNYGVLSTLMPDGRPQTHLVWIDHDDSREHVLVNTERHRQKTLNVKRDPKATVLIFDRNDMWSWVEVRGTVVDIISGDTARNHIDKMAKKYLGVDEYPNPIQTERVIFKIAPTRQLAR